MGGGGGGGGGGGCGGPVNTVSVREAWQAVSAQPLSVCGAQYIALGPFGDCQGALDAKTDHPKAPA